jgi:hypothetical protein
VKYLKPLAIPAAIFAALCSLAQAEDYDDLAAWAKRDNGNCQQWFADLIRARSAHEVASALRAQARRQRKTTDDLIQLLRARPELRNMPELGLDEGGLRQWIQTHPNARTRRAPVEVIAISQEMLRSNEKLDASRGTQAHKMLSKYRDDPEVAAASKELVAVLDDNRRRLMRMFQ